MERIDRVRVPLGFKMAVGIVFIAVVLSSVSIVFGYQTYRQALEDQLTRTAFNLAETMASQVDPASIDRYLETGETDVAYEETRRRLIDIQQNNDIVFAVVTKPTEKGFYYLYDTDQSEEGFVLGDFQEFYPGGFLDNKENFLAGNPIPPMVTNYEFGWLLSALVPILDENGVAQGYVDVDLSMNEIKAMEQDFLIRLVFLLAAAALLLAAVLLVVVRRILVRPINRLSEAAGDFVRWQAEDAGGGARTTLNLPELNSKDELGNLYRSIRQMESDIYAYIDNLTIVTAEKERIGAELDVATHIQASMLPCIFPAFPDRSEFDIYATMQPAKEVGGDFYDFFLVDSDHLAVVIADVSGKGVPAALFMVIAKTLIKDHAQTGHPPDEVFTTVNGKLCESNDEGLFVTAWMGVLQISTGHMVYVNAGHNPPLVRHAGGDFEYLKLRPGFVLAGMEGVRYKSGELDLAPGDTLYLYTDGVTEATDALDGLYGDDRLKAVLDEHRAAPPSRLLPEVKTSIDMFVGAAPQFDDITMLGLYYHGPAARVEGSDAT